MRELGLLEREEIIQWVVENTKNLRRVYETLGQGLDYYLLQIPSINYEELEKICLSTTLTSEQKSKRIVEMMHGANYPIAIGNLSDFCQDLAAFIIYGKDRPETRQFIERWGVWQKVQEFFVKNWKVFDLLFDAPDHYLDGLEVRGAGFTIRHAELRSGWEIDTIPERFGDESFASLADRDLEYLGETDLMSYRVYFAPKLRELGFANTREAVALLWQLRQPDGSLKPRNAEEAGRLQLLLGHAPFVGGRSFGLRNSDFLWLFDIPAQITKAYPDLAVAYSERFQTPREVARVVQEATANWEKVYTVNAGDRPWTRDGVRRWNQSISRHDRFFYSGQGSDNRDVRVQIPIEEIDNSFHTSPDEYLIQLTRMSGEKRDRVARLLVQAEVIDTYFKRITYRRAMGYTDYQQFKDVRFNRSGGAGDTNGLRHAQDVLISLIHLAKEPAAAVLRQQFFERKYAVYTSDQDPFKDFMRKKGLDRYSIYDWFEFHGGVTWEDAEGYTYADNHFEAYQGWEHPTYSYPYLWRQMKGLR